MHSVLQVSSGKLEFILNCSYLTQHWISLKKKQPVTAQKHAINPVPKEVRVGHRKDAYHLNYYHKHPQRKSVYWKPVIF